MDNNGKGDQLWRWMLRLLGVIGFLTLLVVFVLGREVNAVWLFLVGGLLGLDGLAGALRGLR